MKRGIQLLLIIFVICAITGIGLAAKPSQPVDPLSALWDAIAGLQTNDTAQDASIAGIQDTIGTLQANDTALDSVIAGLQDNDTLQDTNITDLQTNASEQQIAIDALESKGQVHFGEWTYGGLDYEYKYYSDFMWGSISWYAPTDGFVMAYADHCNSNISVCAYSFMPYGPDTNQHKVCGLGGITMPVKKEYWWYVYIGNNPPGCSDDQSIDIQFLPLTT